MVVKVRCELPEVSCWSTGGAFSREPHRIPTSRARSLSDNTTFEHIHTHSDYISSIPAGIVFIWQGYWSCDFFTFIHSSFPMRRSCFP